MQKPVSKLNSGYARIPWADLSIAASSRKYASELTHPLYRYPASMSPLLARKIISELSRSGDIVMDPFCGGGTTAIEAIANQRRIICADLNPLACFITKAKSWPMSKSSLLEYGNWVEAAREEILEAKVVHYTELVARSGRRFAPLTHGLLLMLRDFANRVNDDDARDLALLTVLRIGQICFDRRNRRTSPAILRNSFESVTNMFFEKMRNYMEKCRGIVILRNKKSAIKIVQTDAVQLPTFMNRKSNIALMLTSPPYPGTHILYHRWQVYARWETDLPYDLLGIRKRNYESYYTLGSRNKPGQENYFKKLGEIFSYLYYTLNSSTIIAQVVAFSNPEKNISQFREMMRDAGFREVRKYNNPEYIITRSVPHRRWYAQIAPKQDSAREFLFLHVKR